MVAVEPTEASEQASPPQPMRGPGRPPGSQRKKPPSKADLTGLLATANFTIQLAGCPPQLALTTPEVERLADALLELIRVYPESVKYLIIGPKLTAWADLGLCLYAIVVVRVNYLRELEASKRAAANTPARPPVPPAFYANGAEAEAGSAHGVDRNDGLGQNDLGRVVPLEDAVGVRHRPQTRARVAGVQNHHHDGAGPGEAGATGPVDLPPGEPG